MTEQQYEASLLDDPLLTFFDCCPFMCKAGWEAFVVLSVTCVGLNDF